MSNWGLYKVQNLDKPVLDSFLLLEISAILKATVHLHLRIWTTFFFFQFAFVCWSVSVWFFPVDSYSWHIDANSKDKKLQGLVLQYNAGCGLKKNWLFISRIIHYPILLYYSSFKFLLTASAVHNFIYVLLYPGPSLLMCL